MIKEGEEKSEEDFLERQISNFREYERKAIKHIKEAEEIKKKIEKKRYRKKEKKIDLYYEVAEKLHLSTTDCEIILQWIVGFSKADQELIAKRYNIQNVINKLLTSCYESANFYEKATDEITICINEGNFDDKQIKNLKFVLPQIFGNSVQKYQKLFLFTFSDAGIFGTSHAHLRNKFKIEIFLQKNDLNAKIINLYKKAAESWLNLINAFNKEVKLDEIGVTYGYTADCYFSIYLWLKKQNVVEKDYLISAFEYYNKAEEFFSPNSIRLIWNFAEKSIHEEFKDVDGLPISREKDRANHVRKLMELE